MGELIALPKTFWLDERGLLVRGGKGRGRQVKIKKGRSVDGRREGKGTKEGRKGSGGKRKEVQSAIPPPFLSLFKPCTIAIHIETTKKTLKTQKPNLNFAELEIRIYV